MLDAAGKVWSTIQEFMKRINRLEEESGDTQDEVAHLKRDVELLHKGMAHNEKIQTHQGKTIADLEQRIKKLESERHGAKISAGKAKKQLERLKEELRGPKDPKSRH